MNSISKNVFKQTAPGFSLVELLAIIAIAGIVIAVGVPAFQGTIQNNRSASQTKDITAAIQLARSEAVTRKTNTIISSIDDDWNQGLRIWQDANGNTTYDAGEEIFQMSALQGQSQLAVESGATPINQIVFNTSGFVATPTATVVMTLTMHNCMGTNNRTIQLSPSGRVSAQANACN